jgi:hypothetical protein
MFVIIQASSIGQIHSGEEMEIQGRNQRGKKFTQKGIKKTRLTFKQCSFKSNV